MLLIYKWQPPDCSCGCKQKKPKKKNPKKPQKLVNKTTKETKRKKTKRQKQKTNKNKEKKNKKTHKNTREADDWCTKNERYEKLTCENFFLLWGHELNLIEEVRSFASDMSLELYTIY
jgi:hypothetical protein